MVKVVRKRDRIIVLKLVLGEETLNVLTVYASQVDLDEDTKTKF